MRIYGEEFIYRWQSYSKTTNRKFDAGPRHCYPDLPIGLITLTYAVLAFSHQRLATRHQWK